MTLSYDIKLVLGMRCEEESIKTFQSLGGQLTPLDGIKIQRGFLSRFVYEYSMKDVLTFRQIFYSFLAATFHLFFNLILRVYVIKIAKNCEFESSEKRIPGHNLNSHYLSL
jgi:hypothetical protein